MSSSRSSSGYGRSSDHQRRVPAVQEVQVHGASDSVHRRRLDILVVQQRQVRGFMVQKTVIVPQLQFIVGRRHPFRAVGADPHGPVCSADRGDSAVAACFGGRCPCCAGRADSQVLPWRRPWRIYDPSYLAVTCLVFARGVQDYGLFCEKTSRYAAFSASWFNSGYMSTSVYVVVFLAGGDAPRAVFPCLSAFRRRQQWQYTAGFTGDEAPCAVFSFPVVWPKMRDIMAGMDGREGQSGGASLLWCRGRFPWSSLFRRPWNSPVAPQQAPCIWLHLFCMCRLRSTRFGSF